MTQLLRQRIARGGPMALAEYMALALGHPKYGYYQQHDPFGQAGDFVTAPEVSQVFGELLGGWCGTVWETMGAPDPFLLVELGPGRGTLMRDALRTACRKDGFQKAARVHLVETSERLRKVQAEALQPFHPVFHAHPGDVPEGPALFIANEFFDALPIRQFERTESGWRERLVTFVPEEDAFRFTLAQGKTHDLQIPAPLRKAPAGSIAEVSLPALALAQDIGGRVSRFGGAALLLDYGATETDGRATFQSVRAHGFHDPLARPGEADLTAHVDFESLAETARAAGARATAPIPQGALLERLGIHARSERLAEGADPADAEAIRAACRRLIDPEEMGTLFRAMAIAHPDLVALPGFDDD
ncbi:MAG: SAM-dependent methyltransferase [Alphaproteobacteria bacterium]|nr:SAM-dependent methyltransferase [Alphaproteobacteria bacterium]